jgi:hypothetical protein
VNPKAHYRLYLAFKDLNELDKAKEHLESAISQQPSEKSMRTEHKKFCRDKQAKEREWYSKMSGFYGSSKLQQLE